MSDKATTVYTSPSGNFSIDAVKVPGGILYTTAHHEWKVMNTVFVKDVHINEINGKEGYVRNWVDPEKVAEFLQGLR